MWSSRLRPHDFVYMVPSMPITELKAARERRGWTQKELSVASGVSLSVITRVERGVAETRSHALLKLADALEVSTDSLLGRESPTNNQTQPLAAER